MSKADRNFLRRKNKWVTPLCHLPFFQLENRLESMTTRQLRATLRVMDGLTTSNCWWAEYNFAKRYRGRIVDLLASHYRFRLPAQPPFQSHTNTEGEG